MRHGSLFTGIGGFDLAAEWMGWQNIFHCEINERLRNNLEYYWPKAISYADIKQTDFTIHKGSVDILTGGDPCQPHSVAGLRKGKADNRYLWPEMFRAARELDVSWIVNENVSGSITNGILDLKIDDLESAGYTCQAYSIPAEAVGALHQRERIWLVAHNPMLDTGRRRAGNIQESNEKIQERHNLQYFGEPVDLRIDDSNSDSERLKELNTSEESGILPERLSRYFGFGANPHGNYTGDEIKSGIIRSLNGLPEGMDYTQRNQRIQSLGNAIVPQIAFEIFKAIEKYDPLPGS